MRAAQLQLHAEEKRRAEKTWLDDDEGWEDVPRDEPDGARRLSPSARDGDVDDDPHDSHGGCSGEDLTGSLHEGLENGQGFGLVVGKYQVPSPDELLEYVRVALETRRPPTQGSAQGRRHNTSFDVMAREASLSSKQRRLLLDYFAANMAPDACLLCEETPCEHFPASQQEDVMQSGFVIEVPVLLRDGNAVVGDIPPPC